MRLFAGSCRKIIKSFSCPMSYMVTNPVDLLNDLAGIKFPCTVKIIITTFHDTMTVVGIFFSAKYPVIAFVQHKSQCSHSSLVIRVSSGDRDFSGINLHFSQFSNLNEEFSRQSQGYTVISVYLAPFLNSTCTHISNCCLSNAINPWE